jgi:hypothetical protein
MACNHGREFLKSAQVPNNLEAMLNQCISDIKAVIFTDAKKPNPSIECRLSAIGGGGFGICLPPSARIYEVSESMWNLNFPNFRHVRGAYVSALGKIFLRQGKWCRKTLIHEALHSLSVFNVRTDLNRLLFLREGITEFLTGYVMFRRYTECYDAWRKKLYLECRIADYERYVRLWCAFCNFINIKPVAEIYFWNPRSDWQTSYDGFLNVIHRAGYVDFSDIFTLEPAISLEESFIQECISNFGTSFRDVYESRIRGLDFSQVLC